MVNRIASKGIWGPLEAAIGQALSSTFAHMGTVTMQGREVEMYQHQGTQRHLCIDHTGQCWIAVGSATTFEPIPFLAAWQHVNGLRG